VQIFITGPNWKVTENVLMSLEKTLEFDVLRPGNA